MDGATGLSDTARATKQMYEEYPYPSREAGEGAFNELRNLLNIFGRETGFDYADKRVLDAGTGTGHRLAAAAAAYPQARFTAVDFSDASLNVARKHAALSACRFERVNLMEDLSALGSHDLILCMGVLHHLPSPALGLRNLIPQLSPDGVLMLYVYGSRGVAERMRRSQIVRTLLGHEFSFETGLRILKDLGLDTFEYGWNVATDDEQVRNGLLVDAYLNVHETSYTSDSLLELLVGNGLARFGIFGITTQQKGYLFDVSLSGSEGGAIPRTAPGRFFSSDLARDLYSRLSLTERIRVLDLWYQPNGYTLVGFRNPQTKYVTPNGRLDRGLWSDAHELRVGPPNVNPASAASSREANTGTSRRGVD